MQWLNLHLTFCLSNKQNKAAEKSCAIESDFKESVFSKLSWSKDQAICICYTTSHQARNQGGEAPLENFSPSLEKCVGHSSKNLGPSRKTLSPRGAASWLPICCSQALTCIIVVPEFCSDAHCLVIVASAKFYFIKHDVITRCNITRENRFKTMRNGDSIRLKTNKILTNMHEQERRDMGTSLKSEQMSESARFEQHYLQLNPAFNWISVSHPE